MATIIGNNQIKLNGGQIIFVDDCDIDIILSYSWVVDSLGYVVRHEQKNEYVGRKRKMVKLHREIMKKHGININGLYVDHINRNPLDNRLCNLRPASNSQNQANTEICKRNISGYKGVVKCNCNKKFIITKPWAAQITVDGKRIFSGMYETAIDAAKRYNELAKTYFGEYAKLNEI